MAWLIPDSSLVSRKHRRWKKSHCTSAFLFARHFFYDLAWTRPERIRTKPEPVSLLARVDRKLLHDTTKPAHFSRRKGVRKRRNNDCPWQNDPNQKPLSKAFLSSRQTIVAQVLGNHRSSALIRATNTNEHWKLRIENFWGRKTVDLEQSDLIVDQWAIWERLPRIILFKRRRNQKVSCFQTQSWNLICSQVRSDPNICLDFS